MKDNLTKLSTTPLEMEVIHSAQEEKTLSFHTPEGYFILTERAEALGSELSHYYIVNEAAYEDDSISLHFDSESKFQDIYDVVTFYWPVDGEIASFLAGNLFEETPLRLALNIDGRNRLQ